MALSEKEWFIEVPWGRICIVAWGSCLDPPVLLCHGEQDSAASFRPLLRLLPPKFYYIGMELPGMGRSDPFPPGMMINIFDMIYPLEAVRKHFRWDQFVFLAHSVAAFIGRLYNMAYPGRMSKVIELDLITPSLFFDEKKFDQWYDHFFTKFYDKYNIYNSPKENGPKYTWEQAIDKIRKRRGLPEEAARATLERFSEPAGNGLIRLTIDQRIKLITRPPFSSQQLTEIFDISRSPTLAIIADNSVKLGLYKNTPNLLEDKANYKVVKVVGTHDVHIIHPERLAPSIEQFLLDVDLKAKL